RRGEIEAALRRASLAILAGQRRNGAFVWARESAREAGIAQIAGAVLTSALRGGVREGLRGLRERWRARLGPPMRYAGRSRLRFRKAGGDMYSHWFRPLALALAAGALPPDGRPVRWDFGFRDQISQGWWPGAPDARAERPSISKGERGAVAVTPSADRLAAAELDRAATQPSRTGIGHTL
ncbi:MAG: hypothetical protein IH985_07385, partial [Planctomycetes bacterium]|nr:hypothetical protein [Planctomycetota bacterium]